MSKKLYEETNISDIAAAIREKNGKSNQYTTAQMAAAIRDIKTQPILEELNASANGSYTPSSGKDGFSRVNVDVPSGGGSAVLVQKTITSNGTYNALLDDNADGYSEVSVAVDGGGAASFDNILVGSTDPDANIGTPGDMYIETIANRVNNHAYHVFSKVFYKSSQNVWLDNPDTTLPYSVSSIRIKTHSMGNSDASIDVYVNGLLYTNILYTAVQQTKAHYFEDIYGIFIGYNSQAETSPDGFYRGGWSIYPPMNSRVLYSNNWIASPNIVKNWGFNTSVDFMLIFPR